MPLEQGLLIGLGQVPVMGDPYIVIVRHQVEDILFQVGASAGDGMDVACTDHLGQGKPQLGGAHGSGQRDHHLAAAGKMIHVSLGGVDKRRSIEVPVMVFDEIGYTGHAYPIAGRVAAHSGVVAVIRSGITYHSSSSSSQSSPQSSPPRSSSFSSSSSSSQSSSSSSSSDSSSSSSSSR